MSVNCQIIVSQTYFYQGRPVTVMRLDSAFRRARIRTANLYPALDFWVDWRELS